MANYKPQNLSQQDLPDRYAVTFDFAAFEDLVRSQGLDLVHYVAMRCPGGMTDQYDNRTAHDHPNCSNGFIYMKAGEMRALFVGNSAQNKQADVGILDYSSAQVTSPIYYDPNSCNGATDKKIKVLPFDRIYMKDEKITVETWQLFEASQTGIDKLSFPVCCVEYLIDSSFKRYAADVDFEVRGGNIHWISSNRPGYDIETNKGQICTVRYQYRPYYYVSKMLHEIRVSQGDDLITGERKTATLPQAFVVSREFTFEKQFYDQEGTEPPSPRSVKNPETGQFGPR